MTDQPEEATEPTVALLAEATTVDIGVPGITLHHDPTQYMKETGLPTDGTWSVLWAATGHRLHRAPFRTLHAAAHYAYRLRALPGALAEVAAVAKGDAKPSTEFSKAARHAEAHAHDCDATYPAGTVIPMEGGPSIVDDCGTTRRFLSQAPHLDGGNDDEGVWRCAECNEPSAHVWDAA